MANEKKSIFDFADLFGIESPLNTDWVNKDFLSKNINAALNVTITLENILFLKAEDVFQIFFSVLSEIDIDQVKLSLITVNESKNKLSPLIKSTSYSLKKGQSLTESIKIKKTFFDEHTKVTDPLFFKINVTSSSTTAFKLNSSKFEIKTVGVYIDKVTEEVDTQDEKKNLFIIHFTYRSFNTGQEIVKISIHQGEKEAAFLSKEIDLTDSYETPGKISVYKTVIRDRKKKFNDPFLLRATADNAAYSFSEAIDKFNSVSTEKIEEKDITVEQLRKIWTDSKAITISRMEDIVREMNTSYLVNNVSTKLYAIFKVDTPLRRAHFFAQAFVESGSNLGGAFNGEDLYYTVAALRSGSPFSTFKTNPVHHRKAGTIGGIKNPSGKGWKRIPKIKDIANIAYADVNRGKNSKLGNTQAGDGWLFRGRGMLQMTGRENYKNVDKSIKALISDAIDLSSGKDVFTAKEAIFAGFGIWAREELYLLADKGSTDAHVNAVTKKVNAFTSDDSRDQRRKAFKRSKTAFGH